MAAHDTLLGAQKVEIDEPMEIAAMQQAKHLRQRQASCRRADERCAHGLACQQRHPASVEDAFGDQLGIGRPRLNPFAACGCLRYINPIGTTPCLTPVPAPVPVNRRC
jgi:hypothetical protein